MKVFGWEFALSAYGQKKWYRYWLPKRLTLKHNPPIYRFLFWNFGPTITE